MYQTPIFFPPLFEIIFSAPLSYILNWTIFRAPLTHTNLKKVWELTRIEVQQLERYTYFAWVLRDINMHQCQSVIQFVTFHLSRWMSLSPKIFFFL